MSLHPRSVRFQHMGNVTFEHLRCSIVGYEKVSEQRPPSSPVRSTQATSTDLRRLMESRANEQGSRAARPCQSGNCDRFGDPNFMGLCSKCYTEQNDERYVH